MTTLLLPPARLLLRLLERLWLVAVLAAGWWFVSADSTSVYFPALSAIWDALVSGITSGTIRTDVTYSLTNIVLGLVLATIVGTALGILIGELERLRQVLDPFLQFVRSVPQSALIPIVIGALGIGQAPKIYMIAFACVWPVLLNTIDGVRAIAPEVRDMAKAYQIPHSLRLRRMVLPAAMPQIMAGVRVSLAVGVVVMVVSEIFSATVGIGHFINTAGSVFDISAAWAGTLVVGALGYLLSLAFIVVEKAMLGWYFKSAGASSGGATTRTRGKATK
ncbi:MAG: ABC transporter permease subunit [Pseudonocardiaceae bacterium]|nr:ABC transporter permease subunit [Pseudonocardiaceae bacterium]